MRIEFPVLLLARPETFMKNPIGFFDIIASLPLDRHQFEGVYLYI
jgi:hypothetical protein